jgi:hypothetical protein
VHLIGRVANALDIGTQTLAVAGQGILFEIAEKTAYREEWGFEVMRNRIREPLELGVLVSSSVIRFLRIPSSICRSENRRAFSRAIAT